MVAKARGGLVGAGVGAAVAVEELVAGAVAEQIDKSLGNNYVPEFRSYRPGQGGALR